MEQRVELDVFESVYSNIEKSSIFNNERLLRKIEYINSYEIKPYKYDKNVHIRTKDLSKLKMVSMDNMTSPSIKSFKGLLNKLTSSNASTLIFKIEIFLKQTDEKPSELIDTLMCFIQKDKNMVEQYYKIFLVFNEDIQKQNINRLWNKFITDKQWDIPDIYKEQDVFASNYDYDKFCEFKIWNTKVLGYISFWKIHNDNDKKKLLSDILIDTIMEYVEKNTSYKRHMIDIFLEQLYLLDFQNNDKLKNINLEKIPCSSKFKLEKLMIPKK